MPFKNRQQQKSCYATKGWGGKVDCKKYGSDTKGKKQVSSPKNKKR